MKHNDLIEEARKQVTPSEIDAFVKGAKMIMESIYAENVNIVLEDLLPQDSIVLERFSNGSPKVILGPNLGILSQAEAKRVANKGLWRLPTEDQLMKYYNRHESVFHRLFQNGEEHLMSCSTGTNWGYTNPKILHCKDGHTTQIVPNYTPYPVRGIIDLGI